MADHWPRESWRALSVAASGVTSSSRSTAGRSCVRAGTSDRSHRSLDRSCGAEPVGPARTWQARSSGSTSSSLLDCFDQEAARQRGEGTVAHDLFVHSQQLHAVSRDGEVRARSTRPGARSRRPHRCRRTPCRGRSSRRSDTTRPARSAASRATLGSRFDRSGSGPSTASASSRTVCGPTCWDRYAPRGSSTRAISSHQVSTGCLLMTSSNDCVANGRAGRSSSVQTKWAPRLARFRAAACTFGPYPSVPTVRLGDRRQRGDHAA